jgi:hypothetical protein
MIADHDTLQHIDGYLSDVDKNTIATDQLNGLVTDLGHILLDTAQKLQGKVKVKNVGSSTPRLCVVRAHNVSGDRD